MDNINDFCDLSPQLVIPATFEECFTYEEQILYLKQLIEDSEGADLTEIEQRLSAVEASVATLNDEVSQINVDEINAQLQSINADLTELKNKSSAQADSITALQSTVTTQGTEISTVKRQVETQATTVTNLSNSLSTTNNNVTKNTNNIATNTANIASLQSTVRTQGTEISAVKRQVETQATDLTNLSNSLSTTNNNVSRLNDELTETQTTLAGKQNTLTFDSTPTAGSTNPVTSDGIRKAIDEAGGGGGGTSTVEWVEIDLEEYLASLPDSVTYTSDATIRHINDSANSLIPTDMIRAGFMRTGDFVSSDKRYLKVVLNATNVTFGTSLFEQNSYTVSIETSHRPFIYSAYYVTITQEGSEFMFTNNLYSISRAYDCVYSSATCSMNGSFDEADVTTCNIYFKLIPELPIELT